MDAEMRSTSSRRRVFNLIPAPLAKGGTLRIKRFSDAGLRLGAVMPSAANGLKRTPYARRIRVSPMNATVLRQIRSKQPRQTSAQAYAQMVQHLKRSGELVGTAKPKLSGTGRRKKES